MYGKYLRRVQWHIIIESVLHRNVFVSRFAYFIILYWGVSDIYSEIGLKRFYCDVCVCVVESTHVACSHTIRMYKYFRAKACKFCIDLRNNDDGLWAKVVGYISVVSTNRDAHI